MSSLRRSFLVVILPSIVACEGAITSTGAGGDGGGPTGPDAGGGSQIDGGACASIELQVAKQIPDVMLLLDQSGSMTAGFGPTNRWEAMYDTLMNPATGVVKQLENEVRFGLALYTSNGGNAGGVCPMLSEVAPALANHAAIDAVFGPAGPQGDTPTGESITAVAEALAGLTSMGPKVIVLATDGEPDTCVDPNGNGRPGSVAAAQAAYAAGVRIYVVSVGSDVGEAHLQDMANAGAGLAVGGATNEPFYRALEPTELVAAFETIIGGITTCTFTLDGSVDPTYANQGTVVLDGFELQYGTDWTLTDEQTLELLGPACDAIQNGGDHDLRAWFTCDAIIE